MRSAWFWVFLGVVFMVSVVPAFFAEKSTKAQRTANQPIQVKKVKVPTSSKPERLQFRCRTEGEVWIQAVVGTSPYVADKRVREWRERGGNCDWEKITWE